MASLIVEGVPIIQKELSLGSTLNTSRAVSASTPEHAKGPCPGTTRHPAWGLTCGLSATKRVMGSSFMQSEERRTRIHRGTIVPPRWNTGT